MTTPVLGKTCVTLAFELESLLSKTWESILEHSPREAARLQRCLSILPANGGRSWKSVICVCKIHDALQEPWCFALNWLKWLPSIEIELLNRHWSEIEVRLKLSCQWIEFEMKLNYHKRLHWHWISLNLIELTLNFIELKLNRNWIEIEIELKLNWNWTHITLTLHWHWVQVLYNATIGLPCLTSQQRGLSNKFSLVMVLGIGLVSIIPNNQSTVNSRWQHEKT